MRLNSVMLDIAKGQNEDNEKNNKNNKNNIKDNTC